jgi:hypothetical protein
MVNMGAPERVAMNDHRAQDPLDLRSLLQREPGRPSGIARKRDAAGTFKNSASV